MSQNKQKTAEKPEKPTRNMLKTVILPNLDKIEKWAAAGATMAEIAKKLKIGYSTFKRHASSNDTASEPLRAALMTARAVADDAVEASLFRRACGYTERRTVWEEKVTKEGRIVRVRRQMLIDVPPDTAAGQFWLTNRRPDAWRYKPCEDEKEEDVPFGVIEIPAVEPLTAEEKTETTG